MTQLPEGCSKQLRQWKHSREVSCSWLNNVFMGIVGSRKSRTFLLHFTSSPLDVSVAPAASQLPISCFPAVPESWTYTFSSGRLLIISLSVLSRCRLTLRCSKQTCSRGREWEMWWWATMCKRGRMHNGKTGRKIWSGKHLVCLQMNVAPLFLPVGTVCSCWQLRLEGCSQMINVK